MKTLLAALLVLPAAVAAAADLSSTPLFAATLADLDNRPAALARYRGQALIVNFWARWCAPCRAEIPELAKFRRDYRGRIEVLGIGIEDDAGAAREFAGKTGMDYPVFVAREQGIPLMQTLGNTRGALPYTLFIDRDGKIVGQKLGLLREADLEAAAKQLLAK